MFVKNIRYSLATALFAIPMLAGPSLCPSASSRGKAKRTAAARWTR